MKPPKMALFFSLIVAVAVAVAISSISSSSAFPSNHFPLHRTFSLVPSSEFDSLKARDRFRHSRLLQEQRFRGGIVDFSVKGSSDPFVGLYFTKVKLGNPQREFNVQIDTGSDVLWITCSPCDGCPQSSGLGIQLNLFDAASSSSARLVPCSDPICAALSSTTQCLSQSDQCSYTFQYRDQSGTSGYYVTDSMYFDMILGQSTIANSSATIVFGCSTYQSGDLTRTTKALDGIFGFGQGDLSVISQLSSRGVTPKVFSHCLKGGDNGGGILVLGEILEPSIVYSPLVPYHRPHYVLNLESIMISGQLLPNPSVLSTSNAGGIMIDSGTTLAYLVEEVYNSIVSVITSTVSQSAAPTVSRGNQCYRVSSSIAEIFPLVSLNFEGGASMVLKPEEYLQFDSLEAALWCIGFQKAEDGVNILGDLVLKDKIIVYDLARQRIGWANYDCSSSVNVSVTSGKDEFINAGQLSENRSSRKHFYHLIHFVILQLLIHIKVF